MLRVVQKQEICIHLTQLFGLGLSITLRKRTHIAITFKEIKSTMSSTADGT